MIKIRRQISLILARAKARRWLPKHCRGQTLVEYALILAIISIVLVGVIVNLGKQISPIYSVVTSQLAAAQASH